MLCGDSGVDSVDVGVGLDVLGVCMFWSRSNWSSRCIGLFFLRFFWLVGWGGLWCYLVLFFCFEGFSFIFVFFIFGWVFWVFVFFVRVVI